MKQVYCSQCGLKIPVVRKALPQYSCIIEVIQPHECGEVAEIEWDLKPFPIPPNVNTVKDDKFIQKLDETLPNKLTEPGDRRPPEQTKQANLYDSVKSRVLSGVSPTQPSHDLIEEPHDEE